MKKILFVLLVLSVFTTKAQVPSYVPSNGLVAYYPFNGNANDASGNGNNVISNNGASLSMDRHGNKNKAYYLTPGTNLTVAHNANLNVSSNYTIALWYNLKTDIFPASDILIKGPNDWSGNVYLLRQSSITNQKNIAFATGSDNPFPYVVDSMPGMNQWHFIVINISNSLASFYIDNRLVDTTSFPGMTNMANNNSPLKLGGGYYQFEGQLDDIGFWNRSLTTSEMTSLYNAPPICPTSSSITNITIPSSSLPFTWNELTLTGSGTFTTFFTNRAGCDSSATLNLRVTYDIPSYIPTSGLVGYWPFNSNTDDNSGNGNYVVRNDGGASPTTDRFGNSNKAYLFGGRQQLNIPHKSTLNISPNYCISLWVNILSNSSPAGDLLMKGPNDWQGNVFFLRQGTRDANNANISLVSGAVAPFQNVYDSVLTLNQWHLLVINITNSVASFYVDNILTDTTTLPQLQNMVNNQSVLKFGGAYYGFNGKLDDIVFWNRSLTRPEITALYTGVPSCIANITNNDTTICKSSSVTLSAATATGNTYLWSNNATTSTITVSPTVSTKYYCTVKNGTNICKDSVTVTISTIPANIITVDTVKVCGTSASINAITGLSSYAWSNGATTAGTTVTSSGWYKCTVSNGACTAKDSVYVSLFNPKITQNDTTVCAGTSLTMNLNTFVPTSVADVDGNQYPVVKLGTQLWLGQNLRTSRFSNGDSIPEINNGTTWYFTTNTSSPARCSVDLNPSNDNGYGRLYNFYATTDNRNVCPIDWHASTDEEWNTMVKYIEPSAIVDTIGNQGTNASYKLRDTLQQYWPYSGVGAATNQTGFSARAAGARQYYGNFYGVGNYAVYWTTKSLSQFHGYYRLIGGGNGGGINREYTLGIDNKSNGYSVRCLRNQPAILQNSTNLWSTGATTPTITVTPTATTSYIATVSNGINTCKDTVKITVTTINTNFITLDTVKACGTSTSVNATSGFASYSWSNGANTAITTVTSSGWYKCTVNNGICTAKDSVYVSLFNPKILQNDTTICGGTSLTLSVNNNAAPSSVLPANLRSGLVGYWPFNGNANDESGNGNNGTVNGATLTTDRFGNVGKAYEFYNLSQIGGYITTPNILLGDTFTITSKVFWYNSNVSNASSLVSNHDGTIGYELNIIYGVVREHYSNVNNAHFTDSTIPFNEWHQIAWTKTGSTSKLYLDSRLISTKSNINIISNSNVGLFFGRAGWGGNILKGKLDDIAIYKRALSTSEIQQLYTGASSYLWSTGATTSSITVTPTATTSYIATVSNGINTCKDTVKISIHSTPLVPAAIQKQFSPTSIPAVTNVSGLVSETYRIKKVANAISYDWSLKRGILASITHLNPLGVNDTAVTVTFNACFLRDTLCVKSVGICSSSVAKTAILYANTIPTNIAAITTLGGNFAVCIGVSKTFTAVAATPTATQTNIGRYRWTLPVNVSIVSANVDSSTINVQFNAGFTGGNIAVRGVNTCTGTLGANISTTLQYLPPTPTSIVSGTGSNIACINNTISYSVLVAAPTLSQTTATLFRWTKPANTSIISASADSSSITIRFNAGFNGGVLSVKGQSSCGAQSAAKSFSLNSIGCKINNTLYVVNNNTNRTQVLNSTPQNLEAQLYPNPSSGSFNLKINSNKPSPIVVKVMNVNGQMVKSFLAKSNQINQIGSELKSGVYMVIIHQDDEEKVIKAVKM